VQYRFVSHCCDVILLCIVSQISNKTSISIQPTVISCEGTYVSHVKLMLTVNEAFPFDKKYTKLSAMSEVGVIIPKLSLRM